MLFPTLDFGLFFLLVFALAWGLKDWNTGRKLILVAASYAFYAYWDWRFCGLLLASSLINHAAGMAIGNSPDRRFRRQILTLAIAANLGILGFFKY